MKILYLTVFKNRNHLILLIGTVISMILMTVGSQMEIGALGVMARKGPDAFELFSTQEKDRIYRSSIEEHWSAMDKGNKGYISKEDASHYLMTAKEPNLIDRIGNFLDSRLNIRYNLPLLAALLLAVALFKAISLFAHRYFTKMVSIRVSKELRLQYFEHIQALPMSFYHKYNMGSLSSRLMSDSLSVAEAINSSLINYIQMPFTILSTLTLCIMTSWKLTVIIFFGMPLIIIPIIYLARKVKKVSINLLKNQENFSTVILDYLSGIQTVKIFAMEDFSLKKYREYNDKMALLEARGARYDLSSRPIIHSLAMLFLSATLLYGLYFVHMEVAELFVYCGLLYVFYEPIKKFAEENHKIQRGIVAAERMLEVMAMHPQIEDKPTATPLINFEREIEFKNVWFRYEEDWVLQGVSFTIKKGQTVAVVGPTGAGKSTIVQLLPRLYEVQKGEILLDGKPLNLFTQRSLRENIAFVSQKPFLFLDTIAENIAYGRSFSEKEIKEAAKQAYADEFIELMPNGYKTVLQEAGKNLSGGQQQRLAIARALVKKAPILILDEATSSLDNISERRIKNAIHNLKGQVTQIIIAHRLSTIEDADLILYLEKGKILGCGSKEELIKTCIGFRNMWFANGFTH